MMYRFRGSIAPTVGVRASVLSPAVEDGVATLRLYDPIDSYGGDWGVSAKEFAVALAALPADTSEIRLHVNSPGGEVFEAVAIMNQLRAHRARVVAVVDGIAASAASVLVASADEAVMGRNATAMIHDAWGMTIGNAADMRQTADVLDKLSDNLADVYGARNATTAAIDWRAAMRAETWFTADEAVAAGLADSVADGAAVDAKAGFDLAGFRYQGREQAPDPLVPVPAAAALAGSGRWPLATERASRLRQASH